MTVNIRKPRRLGHDVIVADQNEPRHLTPAGLPWRYVRQLMTTNAVTVGTAGQY